ncbi:Autophagy protein 16 [Phlyctema vagabunda]|uniref:Autophagy protein 16 n=1 Tax=Phlyctema vagabunda TaxID=108571 RepID=A0ABR4P3A0_9HELO
MTSWRDEYVQALQERDVREQGSYRRLDPEFIDSFTKLLDRAAALEAEKAANTVLPDGARNDSTQVHNDGNPQLRADLAGALRSNGQLQSRVKAAETELAKIKAQHRADTKLIRDLSNERAVLAQKVRDRDEEIRGKAKLLEDVQDEMISLNLQCNMADQRSKKLEKENKELIDRWMARMGEEADAMNQAFQDPVNGR